MKNVRKSWFIVFIIVIATVVVTVGNMSDNRKQILSQTQVKSTPPPNLKQIQENLEKVYPIAEFDAPESPNITERDQRKAKNARYDKPGLLRIRDKEPVEDGDQYVIQFDSIPFADIPVDESQIIVIGKILDGRAYVSNNKKGVYSEFTIHIDEILKNNSVNLAVGNQIGVDRDGGFVRYKNKNKVLYKVNPFGMPQVGHQYILFLSNREGSPNYYILTGYELQEKTIVNLDNFPQFIKYNGAEKTKFLQVVRDTIKNPPQSTPSPKEGV